MLAVMFRKRTVSSFYNKPLLSLFVLFFISVLIRLPNLNRPLSKHHELNAALVLINSEVWNLKSPAFYNYVPVHSYHQPGDFIYNENHEKSNGYLVNNSFGSLWYIMPYAFFRLMHLPPSPLLLQVFNLLLHLITVLLVYRLAWYFFKEDINAKQKALFSSAVYLFCPSLLWFHGNGYVHEIAVLPFIYAAILVYLRSIHENRRPSVGRYIFLALLIIAGINCDWLMCFVAAAMFTNSLYIFIKRRQSMHIKLLVTLAAATVLAIAIIVVQFSWFMGFQNYMDGLVSRFFLRGIKGDTQGGGLSKNVGIVSFYLTGYGIVIPLITLGLLTIKRYRQMLQQRSTLTCFLIFGAAVCLMHHCIFWGFTNIHDYSVVKSGLIISLLACVAFFSLRGRAKKLLVFTAMLIINISIYYFINRPGSYAANGQAYTYFKSLGDTIKTIASPEEYVFIDVPEMSLLLTYYSKRFYKNVYNENEARNLFKSIPGKKALFIHTSNFEFVSYRRFKK